MGGVNECLYNVDRFFFEYLHFLHILNTHTHTHTKQESVFKLKEKKGAYLSNR